MPASSNVQDNGLDVKFQSAVNLIRSLPKQGQFQPSYDDASKVYGYYKQAQIGPCNQSKPGFWDVVGRAKWNAWSQLGEMSKDEAKKCYVMEITRLFEKLTTSEDFQDQQQQLSDTIIPFCEATGLAVPQSMKENIKMKDSIKIKNSIGEKNKKDDYYGKNGYANGHHKSVEVFRIDAIGVLNGNGNGIHDSFDQEKSNYNTDEDNSFELNGVSLLSEGRETNGNGNAFQNDLTSSTENTVETDEICKVKEALDQESSDDDDDIFCDSINPDDVSGFISFNTKASSIMEETTGTTYNELTRITDDSSLLRTETPPFSGLNGTDKHVHSTPAFKAKALVTQRDADAKATGKDTDYCKHSGNAFDTKVSENTSNNIAVSGETTDISSSLSSSSATDSAFKSSFIKNDNEHNSIRMEDELCKVFAERVPKLNDERQGDREIQQESDRISQGEIKTPNGIDKDQQFVINARGGSSQGDLAGSVSKSESTSRLRSDDNTERPEARSSDQGAKHRSKRSRRQDDSSSDSDRSTRDSQARTETIGEQIVRTLQRLEQDMQMVLLKLNSIEEGVRASNQVNRRSSWSEYLPSRRMMMLLLWPIIINIVFTYWRRRAKR